MVRLALLFMLTLVLHSSSIQVWAKQSTKIETDTVRIRHYLSTAKILSDEGIHIDSAIVLVRTALKMANDGNYQPGLFNGNLILGVLYYYNKGERVKGTEHYEKALAVAQKLNNANYLSQAYYALGIVYDHTHDTTSASEYFHKAFSLSKQDTDEHQLILTIGAVLDYAMQQSTSLESVKKTLDSLLQVSKLPVIRFQVYDMLSGIYHHEGNLNKAIELASQSLAETEKQGIKYKTAYKLLGLADLYREVKNNTMAKAMLTKLIKLSTSTQDATVSAYTGMAYEKLSSLYAEEKKYKEAWLNSSKAMHLKDSLAKVESLTELQTLQVKFDVARKKFEIDSLTKDKKIYDQADTKRKMVMLALAIGCCMLIGFAFVLYRANSRRKTLNQELGIKNVHIEKQHDELKNTLQELRMTQEQLLHSEKMASMGILTTGLAHEINNPLSFIQAGAQSLVHNINHLQELLTAYEKVDANPTREAIAEIEIIKNKIRYKSLLDDTHFMTKAIQTGTARTSAIINGLQRFSRKSTEKVVTQYLAQLIEDTLTLVRLESKSRIKIECTYREEILLECLPGELGQVLLNLFINAVQAIEAQGAIYVTTEATHTHAIIKITDTGSGIKKENLSKIFDPLFTTKNVGRGTGMGLSISYGIIKKHGGEIKVTSEVGKGTEFTITLPLQWSGTLQ